MLDLATLAVAESAPIHLKGPDGAYLYSEGKPVRIHLSSPGSAAFAEVEDRQTARAVKLMQDNDGKVAVASKEQRDADAAADLAALTVDIENFKYGPAEGKIGKELFRAIYADKKLGFITAQVTKALRDWGNFTLPSTEG